MHPLPKFYEAHARSALPPHFRDYCCLRTATVNLGTWRRPCKVTFWGADGRWFLPPWETVDVDNLSRFLESSSLRVASHARPQTLSPLPTPARKPQPPAFTPKPKQQGVRRGKLGGA